MVYVKEISQRFISLRYIPSFIVFIEILLLVRHWAWLIACQHQDIFYLPAADYRTWRQHAGRLSAMHSTQLNSLSVAASLFGFSFGDIECETKGKVGSV